MRFDIFASEYFKISRSQAQKLIKEGLILCNGEKVSPKHTYHQNDVVDFIQKVNYQETWDITSSTESKNSLLLHIKDSQNKADAQLSVEIVYEDEYILIVNKPAGLTVHPGAGNKSRTLVNVLASYYQLSKVGDKERPGIVHRLDKDTSGVMIVAKTDAAHLKVSGAIASRQVKRFYIAVVSGMFGPSYTRVENLIAKSKKDRTKMCIVKAGGKVAVSNYEVIGRSENKFTMLGCSLETGRTHQIRCQLSHMGYPIVGDAVYGGSKAFHRQALHAYSIEFSHPISGENVSFCVKPPQDMLELVNNLHISSKYDFR